MTATIGDNPGADDGDLFKVVACSTQWLNARLEAGPMEFFYPLFTVECYDRDAIEARVRDLVASLEAETWDDLASKIGGFLRREANAGARSADDDWRRLID